MFVFAEGSFMGFKQIDPAVKTRAVKAMRKAVEREGLSAYAAAHKLAAKYEISAGSLQRFYSDIRATSTEDVAQESAKKTKKTDKPIPETPEAPADQPPSAELAPTESAEPTAEIARAAAEIAQDTPVTGVLSGEFTRALEALSEDYVARLQQAALDDLIRKMQLLRDSLQR
jgi:hypothetical protein